MNHLLALHFFKGLTNRQKKALFLSSEWQNNDPNSAISAQLRQISDGEQRWGIAQELAFQEDRICQHEGIQIITIDDVNNFPSLLAELPDPPMALFGRGTWDNSRVPLSIVGTRKATTYGLGQTKILVNHLSQFPVSIISGLALGIDTRAHESALASGAHTCAFLAGGLKSISPGQNGSLAHKMVQEGGGYFTEQPFHTPSRPQYFPVRNRLIAGASLATLIVEAARKSGAMITANQAFNYDRELFALPGALYQPLSEGPNALISEHRAQLVGNASKFPGQFYPLWDTNELELDLSEAFEGRLLKQFPHGRIVSSTHLRQSLNTTNSQLFKGLRVLLDLGVIEQKGAHSYCRKSGMH